VTKRTAGLGWVVAAVVLAGVLSYVTFLVSVLNSCGGGNHGPTAAQEAFCGYGPGESSDLSTLFVLVQLIPAVPVLVGGLLPGVLGRSRLFFAVGLGVGLAATGLIWALEP
jgi:hypothetical protein